MGSKMLTGVDGGTGTPQDVTSVLSDVSLGLIVKAVFFNLLFSSRKHPSLALVEEGGLFSSFLVGGSLFFNMIGI